MPQVPGSQLITTFNRSSSIYVDLKVTPPTTRVENKEYILLICRDPNVDKYQWYLEDQELVGETRQYIDISASPGLADQYSVRTAYDTTSPCYTVSNTASEDSPGFLEPDVQFLPDTFDIKVSPNPVKIGDRLTLEVNNLVRNERYSIRFYHHTGVMSGYEIKDIDIQNFDPPGYKVDANKFNAGINLVVVTQGFRRDVKVFVVHE
jgi:hypothetical protein